MSNRNYDSYCGLYCGACDILAAYKTGQKSRFAAFWAEPLLEKFLRSQGVEFKDKESLQLKCRGCRSDNLFINCKTCQIRKCAITKKVEHCTDCGDHPCALLVGRTKIESLLPHIKSTYANLEAIKKMGVDQWLSEQEKKWQCPDCKTGFAWYTTACMTCGRDLRKNTFKFTFVQSAFLKLGIRLASLKKNK